MTLFKGIWLRDSAQIKNNWRFLRFHFTKNDSSKRKSKSWFRTTTKMYSKNTLYSTMKPTVSRNRLFRTNYHQINSPITSDHPICSNWQESFPKKWKFDELYHSTASGDKYYWHLSWRSWHCSPNIYQTGCSHYYFVCQKKTN